eukprot:15168992-Alexandrium_andersonii.AAC.1
MLKLGMQLICFARGAGVTVIMMRTLEVAVAAFWTIHVDGSPAVAWVTVGWPIHWHPCAFWHTHGRWARRACTVRTLHAAPSTCAHFGACSVRGQTNIGQRLLPRGLGPSPCGPRSPRP